MNMNTFSFRLRLNEYILHFSSFVCVLFLPWYVFHFLGMFLLSWYVFPLFPAFLPILHFEKLEEKKEKEEETDIQWIDSWICVGRRERESERKRERNEGKRGA